MTRALPTVACAIALAAVADARPLTRSEIVSTTVHEAEAIVVAEFAGHRLTDRDPRSGFGGRLPWHLTLRPKRWLRGDLGRQELEVCWWPPPGTFRRPSGSGPAPAPFDARDHVVFLRQDTSAVVVADDCPLVGLSHEPAFVLPSFSPWTPALETEVRRALERQEPEALVAASHRVVLGRLEPPAAGGLRRVRILRTFKGPRTARTLDVRLVDERRLDPRDDRPRLLFLRVVSGGVLEPVEASAGVVPAWSDRVPAWDATLDEAAKRIERAVAAGEELRRRARR